MLRTKQREYPNFKALSEAHAQGDDFIVETREGDLRCLVIAPHGGRIEPATDQFARAIAREDLCLHIFESRVPTKDANLHIKSINYDHCTGLKLAKQCVTAIGIHGRAAEKADDLVILTGGSAEGLIQSVSRSLQVAGFNTQDAPPHLAAKDPRNICNRGVSGGGVQLELPMALRLRLREHADDLSRFSQAVREGRGV